MTKTRKPKTAEQKRLAAAAVMTRENPELAALLARFRELSVQYNPDRFAYSDWIEIECAATAGLQRQIETLESLLARKVKP